MQNDFTVRGHELSDVKLGPGGAKLAKIHGQNARREEDGLPGHVPKALLLGGTSSHVAFFEVGQFLLANEFALTRVIGVEEEPDDNE